MHKTLPDPSNCLHATRSHGPTDPGRLPEWAYQLATDALAEQDLALPDSPQLVLVVASALVAQHLFFNTACFEPSPAQQREFFVQFVLRCVAPSLTEEAE